MKFYLFIIHKTVLFLAIEYKQIEIVKILLQHPKIDINAESIVTKTTKEREIFAPLILAFY